MKLRCLFLVMEWKEEAYETEIQEEKEYQLCHSCNKQGIE